MSKRVKRWRISDVVKALCKERGFKWEYDGGSNTDVDNDAAYVVTHAAREGRSFMQLVMKAPFSLPVVFGMEPLNRTPLWERQPESRQAVEALAQRIVAEARRLKVPRRA
jgi:hypothetical protein